MELTIGAALVRRLEEIPWLSACGQTGGLSGVVWAASRTEAEQAVRSGAWEQVQLDQSGDFTTQLYLWHRSEYQLWNKRVMSFKERHLPALRERWEAELRRTGFRDVRAVSNSIAFDILNLAVIDAYRPCLPTPAFYVQLLEIYARGHLPCGWEGDFLVY